MRIRHQGTEDPTHGSMVLETEPRRRPGPPDGSGQAGERQRPEQLLVTSIVANRHDDSSRPCLLHDSLRHDTLADASHPYFDDLLPFEDFERLIAQGISEQQSKLVRLTRAKLPRFAPIVPGDRCALDLHKGSVRPGDELIEKRA